MYFAGSPVVVVEVVIGSDMPCRVAIVVGGEKNEGKMRGAWSLWGSLFELLWYTRDFVSRSLAGTKVRASLKGRSSPCVALPLSLR